VLQKQVTVQGSCTIFEV